jgi:hypothetical protein
VRLEPDVATGEELLETAVTFGKPLSENQAIQWMVTDS